MGFKWGETDLDVVEGTYIPPHKRTEILEFAVVPGDDLSVPASFLQQSGRGRLVGSLSGIAYSWEGVAGFKSDDLTKTVRTFTDPYGLEMQAIIQEYRTTGFRHGDEIIEYSLVVMEA